MADEESDGFDKAAHDKYAGPQRQVRPLLPRVGLLVDMPRLRHGV